MLGVTFPLVTPPPGVARCPACAAGLAVDQRYCLGCGRPLGRPVMWSTADADADAAPAPDQCRPRPPGRDCQGLAPPR